MGNVSVDNKMRIQTLHEQRLGYRAIAAKYTENWKLDGAPAQCSHGEAGFKLDCHQLQ